MAQQPHEFNIIVNTRPKKVAGPTVSFEQILELAGIDPNTVDLSLYDVDWTHGNKAGELNPGQSVPVENGMKFDAGKSNRS
ncbi:multiubiquitin domain-containing protein [Methylophilus sp. UBA6697]|jgi:hypothetical protein|uniref:multiubiquitin domain-containing protein n=1 Tax=Methylophilus sp. UBA6697 TaxID=1946902 RepID=UPI0025E5CFD5|nr:multiubiquitin domain-containing protein [Methylophilus sp. UBA6697]